MMKLNCSSHIGSTLEPRYSGSTLEHRYNLAVHYVDYINNVYNYMLFYAFSFL